MFFRKHIYSFLISIFWYAGMLRSWKQHYCQLMAEHIIVSLFFKKILSWVLWTEWIGSLHNILRRREMYWGWFWWGRACSAWGCCSSRWGAGDVAQKSMKESKNTMLMAISNAVRISWDRSSPWQWWYEDTGGSNYIYLSSMSIIVMFFFFHSVVLLNLSNSMVLIKVAGIRLIFQNTKYVSPWYKGTSIHFSYWAHLF